MWIFGCWWLSYCWRKWNILEYHAFVYILLFMFYEVENNGYVGGKVEGIYRPQSRGGWGCKDFWWKVKIMELYVTR